MNRRVTWNFLQISCVLAAITIPVYTAYAQEPIDESGDGIVGVPHDTVQVQEQSARFIAKPEMPERPRLLDMLTNVPGDWVAAGETVVSSSAIPYIAAVGAVTGLLVATDKQTDGFSKRITANSEAVKSTSKFLVRLGDGKTHLAMAAGFALYGLVLNDSRAIRTGSQTVEALLACGIAVQALKRISGRESPQAATSPRGIWHLFPNLKSYQQCQPKYYAFPSGHISTTMATVTVIAENYPEVSWIRPVGYSLVGFLGISLVNVGYHWYSDLPLGIAMGYMFGMIASHHGDNLFAFLGNDPYSGLRVLPDLAQGRAGVSLALLF